MFRKLVYIMDMFNPSIYPNDGPAKDAIDRAVYVKSGTKDDKYLELLSL